MEVWEGEHIESAAESQVMALRFGFTVSRAV